MKRSILKWTFKIISITAGLLTACLWALALFGLCVARHLDDGGFAMGRVKLFALCGLCALVVGIINDLLMQSMGENY